MNSAFYQTTDHAGALPPANREDRVATTITLVAVVATCMLLAKPLVVTQHPPIAQRGEAPAVRIVDPDFCKNQTWPYIDARCLKRVAPDQSAAENHAATAPANPGTVANGAASAGSSISTARTDDAIHSAPPTTAVNATGQNQTPETIAPMTSGAATNNSANAPIAEPHRTHHSQHWQHGAFFGFRF